MLNSSDTGQTNNSNTPTLQPMGVSEILDTIFSLYRRHFLLFLGIIVFVFCENLVRYVLGRFFPSFFLKSYIIEFIGISFALIGMGGIIVVTATIHLGGHIKSRDALKQAGQRFWYILACNFPWSLVSEIPRTAIIFLILSVVKYELTPTLFVSIWLVSIPFTASFSAHWGSIISRLVTFVIRPGLTWTRYIPLALSPLSIYFVVRWAFATAAVLLEGTSIRHAFKKSNELTRGSWWYVWGMLISFSVISFAIQRILQITVLSILVLMKVEGVTTSDDIFKWILRDFTMDTDTLSFAIMIWSDRIIHTLIFPIGIIGVTLVYLDLQLRKEGSDIQSLATTSA